MPIAYLIDADEQKVSLVEINGIKTIWKLLNSESCWADRVGPDHSIFVDDDVLAKMSLNPTPKRGFLFNGSYKTLGSGIFVRIGPDGETVDVNVTLEWLAGRVQWATFSSQIKKFESG